MSEAAHRPLCFQRRAFAGSHVGRGPKHANQSAERLRGSKATSVLETALPCGFGAPGRFARAFRAHFGCPRGCRARPAG